jgi:hypothetical protein
MVDIVSANEFTFTPSAFLAAYIEQDVTSSITEVTGNGGSLVTNPNTISNLNSTSTSLPEGVNTTLYFNKEMTGPYGADLFSNTDAPMSSISLTGTELVGQTVSDTRTTTKTTTTSAGVNNTVVLVLSYGQFRSKCANAQATVTKIYQEVAAYLNSL